jgi:hypothetical protein
MSFIVLAVAVGSVGYFTVGICIPRINGVGHFYSFPFGHYAVRDKSILYSLAAWVLVCYSGLEWLHYLWQRMKSKNKL